MAILISIATPLKSLILFRQIPILANKIICYAFQDGKIAAIYEKWYLFPDKPEQTLVILISVKTFANYYTILNFERTYTT